ncbi:hypothetical protein GFL80_24330 [Rhizobium leguminosarum bv. viciae]|uniref:hypothetical protein n=1 Tax=Rhizobium leguminosarum TaxID=384 RepID=UPI001441A2FD|nr:hypothetical protein [Rhizobium leguminosarum]MDH6273553.1 hypothetical protein [Rhizobium leguminosarum]NKK01089.1 hypothetical protein [Rhizobium leguminosarum bv. viciae]NKK87304.1 hypothetical protein [Rhizobium leguminosarum bv. viciae]
MEDRFAIDLTLVKRTLKKHVDLEDFTNAIGLFEAAASVLCELTYDVIGSLDTLAEIHTDRVVAEKFSGALMTHAVISYCRATHSGGSARNPIGAGKYTADQRKKHDKITDLRDKVIAHFGSPTKEYGLKWLDERATVRVGADDENFKFSRRRAKYLGAAIADLRELAPIAADRAKVIRDERAKALNELYLKHAADPRVVEAMALRFDPNDFFGPGPVADGYWDGDRDVSGEVPGPQRF